MLEINENPRGMYAESFRTIKTNIKYSSADKAKKVILITSSWIGEGKSTVATNLAVSLSQDKKKVLIVDCDLRKPSIHKKFRISRGDGLTEILIGEIDLGEAIYKYDDYLDILTAGTTPPNPAELLSSDAMDELFNKVKGMYDYVIVDTTPLGVVADSQILSSKVDGVILVAFYEKTKKEKLVQCKKLIDQVGGNIIGAIINNVKITKDSYYYY